MIITNFKDKSLHHLLVQICFIWGGKPHNHQLNYMVNIENICIKDSFSLPKLKYIVSIHRWCPKKKPFNFHNLTFPKSCLSLCLQVLYSSLLLFRVAPSGANMMRYFSFKQSWQIFVMGLKTLPLAKIFQETV